MGRRKIEIQPILDERNRTVTFIKRKAGLFKKAHELAVLCSVDVVVLVLGANNTFYEFSSVDPNEMIRHYQNNKNLAHDVKTPADFGNYQRKRFLLIDQDRISGGYDHSSRVKRRRVSVSSQTSRTTISVGKHKFSPPQNHAVPAAHGQLKAGKTISTTSGVRSGSSISSISSSASSSSSSSVRSSMQGNAALSKVQKHQASANSSTAVGYGSNQMCPSSSSVAAATATSSFNRSGISATYAKHPSGKVDHQLAKNDQSASTRSSLSPPIRRPHINLSPSPSTSSGKRASARPVLRVEIPNNNAIGHGIIQSTSVTTSPIVYGNTSPQFYTVFNNRPNDISSRAGNVKMEENEGTTILPGQVGLNASGTRFTGNSGNLNTSLSINTNIGNVSPKNSSPLSSIMHQGPIPLGRNNDTSRPGFKTPFSSIFPPSSGLPPLFSGNSGAPLYVTTPLQSTANSGRLNSNILGGSTSNGTNNFSNGNGINASTAVGSPLQSQPFFGQRQHSTSQLQKPVQQLSQNLPFLHKNQPTMGNYQQDHMTNGPPTGSLPSKFVNDLMVSSPSNTISMFQDWTMQNNSGIGKNATTNRFSGKISSIQTSGFDSTSNGNTGLTPYINIGQTPIVNKFFNFSADIGNLVEDTSTNNNSSLTANLASTTTAVNPGVTPATALRVSVPANTSTGAVPTSRKNSTAGNVSGAPASVNFINNANRGNTVAPQFQTTVPKGVQGNNYNSMNNAAAGILKQD